MSPIIGRIQIYIKGKNNVVNIQQLTVCKFHIVADGGTLKDGDAPTLADYWNELVVSYDADYQTLSDTEAADSGLFTFLDEVVFHCKYFVTGAPLK